jgi:hypothetical protein
MNKAKAENQEICRNVRREMGRHSVDCGEVQVSATHGVIHLHGKVRPMRGHEEQFESAIKGLLTALRQKSGIRDVYPEWTMSG